MTYIQDSNAAEQMQGASRVVPECVIVWACEQGLASTCCWAVIREGNTRGTVSSWVAWCRFEADIGMGQATIMQMAAYIRNSRQLHSTDREIVFEDTCMHRKHSKNTCPKTGMGNFQLVYVASLNQDRFFLGSWGCQLTRHVSYLNSYCVFL